MGVRLRLEKKFFVEKHLSQRTHNPLVISRDLNSVCRQSAQQIYWIKIAIVKTINRRNGTRIWIGNSVWQCGKFIRGILTLRRGLKNFSNSGSKTSMENYFPQKVLSHWSFSTKYKFSSLRTSSYLDHIWHSHATKNRQTVLEWRDIYRRVCFVEIFITLLRILLLFLFRQYGITLLPIRPLPPRLPEMIPFPPEAMRFFSAQLDFASIHFRTQLSPMSYLRPNARVHNSFASWITFISLLPRDSTFTDKETNV